MNRYHIKYQDLRDILELLPERTRHDMLRNDVPAIENRNAGEVPYVSRQHMFIDDQVKIIEVALMDAEYEALRSRGVTIEAKNMQLPVPLAGYDTPGPDPRFQNSYFPGLLNFNNAFARVQSADFSQGMRKEFYNPFAGGTPFSVEYNYDAAYETQHLVGGKMIQPNQFQQGITHAWSKGLTGAGVKICVVDFGYSGLIPHRDLDVPNTRTFNFYTGNQRESADDGHATSMLSLAGAKASGAAGVIGNAFGSTLYAANANNPGASISWGASQGCRIFSCSFQSDPDLYFTEAAQKVRADGGIVLVAAGNSVSGNYLLQPLATVRGIVAIGGSIGGLTLQYQDKFRFTNIVATNGQRIRFVYPAYAVGAAYRSELGPAGDYYRNEVGTSPSTSQTAGALALLAQRYPGTRLESLLTLVEQKSSRFIDRGITTTSFNLHFLR